MFCNAISTVSRIPPGGNGPSPDASVVQTPSSVFGGGNGLAGSVSTLSPINRSGSNPPVVFGGGNGLAGSVDTLSPISRNSITPTASSANNVVTTMGNSAANGLSVFAHANVID